MQNSMVMFTFFIFGWKYPVWDNLVQKFKIVSLRWNLIPKLIQICRIQWYCSVFCFRTETAFLGKFGPNCQYLLFKVKLDTLTNSIMQNSMAVFTFFFSDQKRFFWANLVQNVKIVSLRLNLVASIGILKSHTHQKEYHQPSVDGTC